MRTNSKCFDDENEIFVVTEAKKKKDETQAVVPPAKKSHIGTIVYLWNKTRDVFHSTKIPVRNFGTNFTCPMERYIPVAKTRPSNRTFGYCSWKQDTKQRYWPWGQQFWQMERDISVQLTEITGPVKEDHLQSWSRIFRSDQTDMVRCIWNFRNFGLNGKRPIIFL